MMRISLRFFSSVSKRKSFVQHNPDQRFLDHLDRLGLGYVPRKQTRKAVAIKYRQIGMGKGPGKGYAYLDESTEHPFPFDRGAKQVRMIDVADDIAQLPDYGPAPEVALIGRSNVGKSTLLNALMGFKSHTIEAKVSDKPGETKSLHFYGMGKPRHIGPPALVVVDMPGYGFAFMEEETQKKIFDLSALYLLTRGPVLKRVLLLVDARHGIKIADTNFFASLNELSKGKSRPEWKLQIVMTKCDMVSRDDLARRANEVQESIRDKLASIALSNLPIIMVSGLERKGVIDLHREIASLVPRKHKEPKERQTEASEVSDVSGSKGEKNERKDSSANNDKPVIDNKASKKSSTGVVAVLSGSAKPKDNVPDKKEEGTASKPDSNKTAKKKENDKKKASDKMKDATADESISSKASREGLKTAAASPSSVSDVPIRRPKDGSTSEPIKTTETEEVPRKTGGRKKRPLIIPRMQELSEEDEDDDEDDFMYDEFDDLDDEDFVKMDDDEFVKKVEEKKLSETLKPNPISKRGKNNVSNKESKGKAEKRSPYDNVVSAPVLTESSDVESLDISSRLSSILEHYEKISAKQEVAKPNTQPSHSKPSGAPKPASASSQSSSRFTGRQRSENEVEKKQKRKEIYKQKFGSKNEK